MSEPPVTPIRKSVTTPLDGSNASQQDLNGSKNLTEALAFRGAPDKVELNSTQPPAVLEDPRASQSQKIEQDKLDIEPDVISHEMATSSRNPGPFDWDTFEARYDQAMADAKAIEGGLLNEFQELSRFFGTWAAAASEHDDDRALKRLKTRETYIQTAEQSLEQKKMHHAQVVEAFKNALAMLGGP